MQELFKTLQRLINTEPEEDLLIYMATCSSGKDEANPVF